MEFIGNKRGKKRSKRKRRYINSKQGQGRNQIKFEVRTKKHQKIATKHNVYIKNEKIDCTMEANAFWENYKAAHEWQKRHNVTWWKTRCFALEHENHVLKETLRNLVQNQKYNYNSTQLYQPEQSNLESTEFNNEDNCNDQCNDEDNYNDDNLEFHLDENMMNFLAQSIQHKIELKNKRDSEIAMEENEENNEKQVEGGLTKFRKRTDDAKLLYGEASSRILAMETALQTSVERHVDKAKPQYWPNIPIKL